MDIPSRTPAARLAPLEVEAWDPKLREQLLGNRRAEMGAPEAPVFNIFKTLARHPRLAGKFARWGDQILFKSSLSPRTRELAILRVGWLARQGPVAGSDADDDVLLRAVDELVGDHFIADATWAALAARYDEIQLIDLVFTVGQYAMVCRRSTAWACSSSPNICRTGHSAGLMPRAVPSRQGCAPARRISWLRSRPRS